MAVGTLKIGELYIINGPMEFSVFKPLKFRPDMESNGSYDCYFIVRNFLTNTEYRIRESIWMGSESYRFTKELTSKRKKEVIEEFFNVP